MSGAIYSWPSSSIESAEFLNPSRSLVEKGTDSTANALASTAKNNWPLTGSYDLDGFIRVI